MFGWARQEDLDAIEKTVGRLEWQFRSLLHQLGYQTDGNVVAGRVDAASVMQRVQLLEDRVVVIATAEAARREAERRKAPTPVRPKRVK